MLVGYARVSTDGQNLDRQIDALKAVGVDSRVQYQEKITGTKKDRPELQRMLKELNEGDVVKALADSGMKIVDIVKETGLSRSTVNRILRDSKQKWRVTKTKMYMQYLYIHNNWYSHTLIAIDFVFKFCDVGI